MANSANKKAYNADYAASKLKRVSLDMQIAAYEALANLIDNPDETHIIPEPFDKRVVPSIAKAVKQAAIKTGVTKLTE